MRAILIMLATYTRIPMPHFTWREEDSRRAIGAFPLAGILIGIIQLGVMCLAEYLSIPHTALVCLLLAVPILMTGGIHLDGFIDTVDARSSYRDTEEKLRILKDPHVGAFGIIRLVLYILLAAAGLLILLDQGTAEPALFLLPAIVRACSGLAAVLLPKARKEGMLHDMVGEKPQTGVVTVLLLQLLLGLFLVTWLVPLCGGMLILALGGITLYYRFIVVKEFGGTTGDLAGWYLCVLELGGIWAYAAAAVISGLF